MTSLLRTLRTLLILGRVSNLPTVWSNLLAGSILVGQWKLPPLSSLIPLLLGGSFIYVGGMYLNDFCDSGFDARYCPQRPIPAKQISRRMVGVLTILWFIAGMACLMPFGPVTMGIGLLLISTIVLYDFHHKNVVWAPLVMGLCRILLYPLAASAVVDRTILLETGGDLNQLQSINMSFAAFVVRLTLGVIPIAIPLGLYVAGITYLAKGESRPEKPTRWALLLLLLPVAFSFSTYANLNLPGTPLPLLPVILVCLLQLSWLVWLLVPFWRKSKPSVGRVVSGLLAGIVLVDMIALVPLVGPLGIVLFPLFALALLLQRIIPAT